MFQTSSSNMGGNALPFPFSPRTPGRRQNGGDENMQYLEEPITDILTDGFMGDLGMNFDASVLGSFYSPTGLPTGFSPARLPAGSPALPAMLLMMTDSPLTLRDGTFVRKSARINSPGSPFGLSALLGSPNRAMWEKSQVTRRPLGLAEETENQQDGAESAAAVTAAHVHAHPAYMSAAPMHGTGAAQPFKAGKSGLSKRPQKRLSAGGNAQPYPAQVYAQPYEHPGEAAAAAASGVVMAVPGMMPGNNTAPIPVAAVPAAAATAFHGQRQPGAEGHHSSGGGKRGEYRCGDCGFYPKKTKHNCEEVKAQKVALPSAAGDKAPVDVAAVASKDPLTKSAAQVFAAVLSSTNPLGLGGPLSPAGDGQVKPLADLQTIAYPHGMAGMPGMAATAKPAYQRSFSSHHSKSSGGDGMGARRAFVSSEPAFGLAYNSHW